LGVSRPNHAGEHYSITTEGGFKGSVFVHSEVHLLTNLRQYEPNKACSLPSSHMHSLSILTQYFLFSPVSSIVTSSAACVRSSLSPLPPPYYSSYFLLFGSAACGGGDRLDGREKRNIVGERERRHMRRKKRARFIQLTLPQIGEQVDRAVHENIDCILLNIVIE
jgi:hypothetical protein